MRKPDLLVVKRYSDEDMHALEAAYTLHVLSDADSPDALLGEVGPRIRALATNGESGADARLINALPQLEIIVCYGVGVDAIDLALARSRQIRVTNTPDVLTGDVADMGLALMLSIARQIPTGDACVRRGEWPRTTLPLTTRVFGKRLGILGLGRVGRAVAKRAAGFDMSIAYHDHVHFQDVDYAYYDDPVALAADVDFLMVCAAADASNKASIGSAIFEALGPQGRLINIARGSILDEPQLLRCLQEGRLGGAALDVFWNEPDINPAFAELSNVVLQPHRSSATVETRRDMARLVRENLAAFHANQRLVSEYLR
jgi:D-3-phosphoglycerate dehydrogenase